MRTLLARLPCPAPIAAALAVTALTAASPAAAQTLRGRVIAEATLAPVEGAFVTLVDETGQRADAGLSDARGFYRLAATVPGRYRAQVDRIGFERWVSEPFDLARGQDHTQDLAITVRPVRLADLDVQVRTVTGCLQRREDEGSAVWDVWEEARKALDTSVFADEEELFRFNSLVTDLIMDAQTFQTLERDSVLVTDVTKAPFQSLEPGRLLRRGYIQEVGDTAYFYAPDASVLLSPSFLDTHCFGLDSTLPNLLGLTFEPIEDRKLPEIAGVIWLDIETAELTHLEFRYVNIPYRIPEDRLGGWVDFVRLPGGPFVVENWWVRTPVMEMFNFRLQVTRYWMHGGKMADVFTRDGQVIDWR